jgi:phenylpropionate dioxygenase-like ring-hydroxylating dioxygenase large terminal subunit
MTFLEVRFTIPKPDGAVAFDLGAHRYAFNGNWKLRVENVLDSYHVSLSHVST